MTLFRCAPSRLTVATLAVVALAAAAPAAGADAPLTCGAVVTSSVTLTADLTCAPGQTGIIVRGQDVVVDLNGHTLDGQTDQLNSVGVWVDQSARVEVRGGTITRFGIGVRLDSSTAVHVWGLTLPANVRGVDIANASGSTVDRNRISGSGLDGIRLDGAGSYNDVIAQNTLSGNVFGIGVFAGAGNTLAQNTISGTRHWGVAVLAGAANTVLSRNTVSANGGNGVEVQASAGAGTVLTQNTVTGNGADGLQVRLSGVRISKTLATYNADNGIDAPGAFDGGGNKAAWNVGSPQCTGVTCSAP